MWNARMCTMAIVGAVLAATGPASAQYRNSGYAGVYGYGWPHTSYAGSYDPNAYGYGGLEDGRSAYGAAPAPAPERARPLVRRRAPKRLE